MVPGLEPFAEDELRRRFGRAIALRRAPAEGRISIEYLGEPGRLNDLRTATAVYAVTTFEVPRPKALLGHEHQSRLLELIRQVRRLWPPGRFATFRVSAAGAESPVFSRLAEEIADGAGLESVRDQADLLIAVRRPPNQAPGWQVLVRLSPRPLSARPWRVCNLPGALNATVAHVMDELAEPRPGERFLNLACGSGTLMIERLTLGPARQVVGVDLDGPALECARANLEASGQPARAELIVADVAELPLPASAFDTIVADLPFGMLLGSRAENQRLYPALVAAATRTAAPGASLVIITASKPLFEESMESVAREWISRRVIPIKLSFQSGYLHPSIYVFERRGSGGSSD